MNAHDLLIRHAVAWADKRKIPLDADILQTVLDLRDFHDEQRPQAWPTGSAEHLMLVRWPSHGPSEVPDADRLVGTLDTFWRFLRGSGRMATESADPKALVKEARRAAPRMAQACADRANRSATKSLVEFGKSIGISLDEASSVEELQERMDQVTQAWNALPMEERLRLAPSDSAHQGSLPGQRTTSLAQALAMSTGEPPGHAAPGWLDDVGPDDDDMMPRKDPPVVARGVQQSPFVQQVLRLANWVGEGRAVTATGVLTLAGARTAYTELGLHEWETRVRASWHPLASGESPGASPEEVLDKVRSSADLRSLNRLWEAAATARLIEVGRTKARQVPVEARSTDDWVHLGMLMLLMLCLSLPRWSGQDQVVFGTLLTLLAYGEADVEELEDWWWGHGANRLGRLVVEGLDEDSRGHLRGVSDGVVAAGLAEFADTGAWRQEGGVLQQTDLGYELALLLARIKEEGLLDED